MQCQTSHQYTCVISEKRKITSFFLKKHLQNYKLSIAINLLHFFSLKKRGSGTSHQSCLRFQEPNLLHGCIVDLPNKQTLYVFLSIFSSLHSYCVPLIQACQRMACDRTRSCPHSQYLFGRSVVACTKLYMTS